LKGKKKKILRKEREERESPRSTNTSSPLLCLAYRLKEKRKERYKKGKEKISYAYIPFSFTITPSIEVQRKEGDKRATFQLFFSSLHSPGGAKRREERGKRVWEGKKK